MKRHGTSTKCLRHTNGTVADATIIEFADASHTKEASQLCYVVGLMICTVVDGNILCLLVWESHRTRRPAKSTHDAEMIAASEEVDEIVLRKNA